jgi:histidine ammonia-lyase/phenylalanine ammonia-lyase
MVAHYDLPIDGILLDGWGLTVDTVATVADGRSDRVRIAPSAIRGMRAVHELKDVLSDGGRTVNGVLTVVGNNVVRPLVPAGSGQPQRDLIRYHLSATGPAAPRDVVRATLLIRANCLTRGRSGIRPEVVGTLLELLNRQALPRIPERAVPGGSGDLAPLCHVASALLGESVLTYRGADRPAAEVLDELGLRPVELEAQEGLALINGTAFSSAFASVATSRAWRLAPTAELCTALAAEAVLGDRDQFASVRHDSKAYPGQATAAEAIADLLADSELALGRQQIAEIGTAAAEGPIDDRYAIHCAPQVIGVLRDTLPWVSDRVEAEINSADDSPLFDPMTGEVRSGDLSGRHLTEAMDALTTAVANLADLVARQLDQLVDDQVKRGRTANPVCDLATEQVQGLAGLRTACSAVTEEALRRGAQAGALSSATEAADHDAVDRTSVAARDALHVVALTEEATAIHLLALCTVLDRPGVDQAGVDRPGVDRPGVEPGVEWLASRLRPVHALIRKHMPSTGEDRTMQADIAAVLDLIRTGELLAAC